MAPVLSAADLEHWREHGFVVARAVISPDQARRSADEIWEFASRPEHSHLPWHLGPRAGPVDGWYAQTENSASGRGHVEMYHGKQQWANRTAPRVYEAFSQIHDSLRVTCSTDRCCINPPSRNVDERLESLHWDRMPLYSCNIDAHGHHIKPQGEEKNVWEVIQNYPGADLQSSVDASASGTPHDIQGVLYLTDVPEDAAAFTIVPGFHRRIKPWLQSLPPDTAPSREDLLALGAVPVPGRAGDLIIWNSLCPHAGGVNHNREGHVRVVQFLGYSLAPADQSEEARKGRIEFWREGQVGNGNRHEMPNEPGCVELTPLGRKIAQLDPWEAEEGSRRDERRRQSRL